MESILRIFSLRYINNLTKLILELSVYTSAYIFDPRMTVQGSKDAIKHPLKKIIISVD